MNLADMENEVLAILQQPQVNYGGIPNWTGYPALLVANQSAVDYAINRGYIHTMMALADIEIYSYTVSFPSQVNVSQYALPPPEFTTTVAGSLNVAITQSMLGTAQTIIPGNAANMVPGMSLLVDQGMATQETVLIAATDGASYFTATFLQPHAATAQYFYNSNVHPAVQKVQRVYYTPFGQTYTREEMPGVSLIDWQTFQAKYSAGGYLRQFSYGTEPQVCALSPDRLSINFYPGASTTGDGITIAYMPIPTATSYVPLLSYGGGPGGQVPATPVLPDDCHDAIVYYAAAHLWPRFREFGAAKEYMAMYQGELDRIRTDRTESSKGANLRFSSAEELYTGPYATYGAGLE